MVKFLKESPKHIPVIDPFTGKLKDLSDTSNPLVAAALKVLPQLIEEYKQIPGAKTFIDTREPESQSKFIRNTKEE